MREKMELLRLLDQDKQQEDDQKNQIQLKNLYEAAMSGSVQLLSQILKENPQILQSPEISTTPENPLHAAALLGHLEFAKKLLSANPELSKSLSSSGSSALHLAAAKGDAEMVKELVSTDSSMCGARDGEGRNPVHLAAIKGRTAVLEELLKADPAAITGGGDSCLHLCVKYNRVEAMKVILQFLEGGDDRLVNWKDRNGNTILHLAVEKKQLEIVEYLIDNTRIENGARNAAGLTALDLLLQNPGDLRDLEIKQCLEHQHNASSITNRNAASQSSKKSIKPSSSKLSTNMQPKKHKHTDWLGRKRSAVMIVASLTATVAFQAGLSPPGGVWQGDFAGNPNGTARADRAHKAGQSVMAYTLPDKYGQYMVFNTIAFLASLSIILLQVSGLPMRRRRWMWTQMVTMWIAISAQTLTYFVTLINMTPKHVENTVYHVARVSVILWLVLMAVVFIGNMTRAVLYVMRKYGYAEEKEREVIVYEEEEDEL
ncbi:ankyrin repeat-containing protein BDA1-like [Salvia splendens]|uniref:ankyrin repeat-containing protein BDA1-like n=1 Tax=Salvia splendens TaxID=180675 RepID=UPI0011037CAE|nr:ankyrin repeat-containing protein BDA1-like [Salvia splendens]